MSRQSAALATRRHSLQGSPASVQSRIGSVILSSATFSANLSLRAVSIAPAACGPIGQRSGALGQNDWKPGGWLHGRGDFIDDLVCCSQGAHSLLPAGLDARRPWSSPRSEIVALLKARDDLAKCGIARCCAGLSIIANVGRPVEFASRRRVRDRVERNGLKTVAVRTLSDRAHDHLFQLVAGSYRLVHGFRPCKRPPRCGPVRGTADGSEGDGDKAPYSIKSSNSAQPRNALAASRCSSPSCAPSSRRNAPPATGPHREEVLCGSMNATASSSVRTTLPLSLSGDRTRTLALDINGMSGPRFRRNDQD